MNVVKAAFGTIIAVGIPIAFALIGIGLGFAYDHQVVHDLTLISSITPAGGGELDKYVPHVYTHSSGGIAAVAGAIGFAWALLSAVAVLAGGALIAKRNHDW